MESTVPFSRHAVDAAVPEVTAAPLRSLSSGRDRHVRPMDSMSAASIEASRQRRSRVAASGRPIGPSGATARLTSAGRRQRATRPADSGAAAGMRRQTGLAGLHSPVGARVPLQSPAVASTRSNETVSPPRSSHASPKSPVAMSRWSMASSRSVPP